MSIPDTVRAEKLAYTINEVIALTGIRRSSLYEDMKAGLLRARKRGRTTLILTGDLLAYLEALPSASGGSPQRE